MPDAGNPHYVKLAELVKSALFVTDGHAEVPLDPESTEQITEQVLDAIWPEIVEHLAKIEEYEHALEHIAEFHPTGPVCPDCQTLAKGALDGLNREMCREIVRDD